MLYTSLHIEVQVCETDVNDWRHIWKVSNQKLFFWKLLSYIKWSRQIQTRKNYHIILGCGRKKYTISQKLIKVSWICFDIPSTKFQLPYPKAYI